MTSTECRMNSLTPQPSIFSVVIHDVAPATWPACQRLIQAIKDVADIPLTLLVVPRYHLNPSNRVFEQTMRHLMADGHELALHGYSHLDEGSPSGWLDHIKRRWYTAGEGEFSALHQMDALRKLQAGMSWFERRQWPLHGFVAPAWLMSPGTWRAVQSLPLRYTATLGAIYALPNGARLNSDCLAFSTRSWWRRAVSLPRNAWVAARWQRHRLVRLELHPHDADYPLIRRCWTRQLEKLMMERQPLTLANAISRIASQPAHPAVLSTGA